MGKYAPGVPPGVDRPCCRKAQLQHVKDTLTDDVRGQLSPARGLRLELRRHRYVNYLLRQQRATA